MYKGVHSKAARVIKGEEKNQVRNRSEFPQKGALVLTVGGRRMAYLNTSGINMGCLWLLVHVCYLHVSVLPNICSLSLQVKLTKTIVDSTLNKGMYRFVFGRIASANPTKAHWKNMPLHTFLQKNVPMQTIHCNVLLKWTLVAVKRQFLHKLWLQGRIIDWYRDLFSCGSLWP